MFVFYPLPTRNTDRLRDAVLKNAFSNEECNKIISIQNNKLVKSKPSGELYEDQESGIIKNFLSQRIINDSDHNWLFKKLSDYTEYINKTYYNFIIEEIRETYLVKFEKGNIFPSHVDIGKSVMTSGRKLTYIINLSSQNSYDGAFVKLKYQSSLEDINQGDMIVIPSFMPYEVTELLNGEKYFLLSYAYGPHYR